MTPGLRESRRAAVGAAVLGGYLQLVEWVDLFPWNDIRDGNGQETLNLALAVVSIGLVWALWRGGRIATGLATAALTAWAWLQFATWWVPYIGGATPGWKRVWERWWGETIHVLPRTSENLPPDLNHLVLQALIVTALALSAVALRASFRRS